MADQLSQQLAAAVQQVAFAWIAVDQLRQGASGTTSASEG